MRFTAAQRHAAWFLLTAPSASAGRQGSDHAFFDEDLERSAGDGASERVAAESTAMLARFQHAEDLVVREHRRYRIEAARQRLADQGKIGLDPFMLFGEQPAGAAEPSLNLVGNSKSHCDAYKSHAPI